MKSLLGRLRTRRLVSTFTILATLSAGILIGSFVTHGVRGQESAKVDTSDATPLKVPQPRALSTDFTRIAKEVGPAVVNINTITLPKERQQGRRNPHSRQFQQQQPPDDDNNNDDDDQDDGQGNFQDFFNRFFGGQGQMPDEGGQERESLGSGFIVDPRGYILTNNHVVDKADRIFVRLSTDPDGGNIQARPAKVVGVDKDTDLAVIKIDTSSPLPTVRLGDSEETKVGDWVEAIGSPFALSQTVTAGIISAKNRTIEPGAAGQFQHFIQTDAAINPGNSGGPLLNMNGDVIGVNTAIYTQSAGYQGIGFAMPSNTVAEIYNDLISPGHKVVRGSIGIQFRNGLSSAVNRVYGFKNGVLVQEIQPGGPADKAGLKQGDIITQIDGRSVKDGDDLVSEIASRRPGSTVRLGLMRDGKMQDTTVTIGDRDKVFADLGNQAAVENPEEHGDAGEEKLGIAVREVSPQVASKLHGGGVAIQSVRTGSFADLQGLQPGLVIVRINKQPTATKEQYDAVVAKLKPGDDVVFEIMDPRRPADGINYVGGSL
jgi:serine protease Do